MRRPRHTRDAAGLLPVYGLVQRELRPQGCRAVPRLPTRTVRRRWIRAAGACLSEGTLAMTVVVRGSRSRCLARDHGAALRALRAAAEQYAARGWPVLPGPVCDGLTTWHPVTFELLGGREPTVPRSAATVDPRVISEWWAVHRQAILAPVGRHFDVLRAPTHLGWRALAAFNGGRPLGPMALSPHGAFFSSNPVLAGIAAWCRGSRPFRREISLSFRRAGSSPGWCGGASPRWRAARWATAPKSSASSPNSPENPRSRPPGTRRMPSIRASHVQVVSRLSSRRSVIRSRTRLTRRKRGSP